MDAFLQTTDRGVAAILAFADRHPLLNLYVTVVNMVFSAIGAFVFLRWVWGL